MLTVKALRVSLLVKGFELDHPAIDWFLGIEPMPLPMKRWWQVLLEYV